MILLIIVLVTIIVAVIGITIFWRERKSKHHTQEESVYYSTIDETKSQRTPKHKPETIYSEIIDVKVSKEEPCYMKTSKCTQSTIAEKVTIQDNPSYFLLSDHHVKIEDNPAYSTWLYHKDEIKDDPSQSENQDETKVNDIPSEHQGETQTCIVSLECPDEIQACTISCDTK